MRTHPIRFFINSCSVFFIIVFLFSTNLFALNEHIQPQEKLKSEKYFSDKHPWQSEERLQEKMDLKLVSKVQLKCGDELCPTHQHMDQKLYHIVRFRQLDASLIKISPDETRKPRECLTWGLAPATDGKIWCIKPDSVNYYVMSDLFKDSCGNYYRGYMDRYFLKRDENMGTLVSDGRRIYENPNSQFKGDFSAGDTYCIKRSTFLFLTDPFDRDQKFLKSLKTNKTGS